MTKVYVFDTNVLLNDPSAVFETKKHDVIIPYIVLEELDKHKNRQDAIGANARKVSRKFLELITNHPKSNLNKGIPLSAKNNIRFLSVDEIAKNESSNDNVILETCIHLKEDGYDPILVTNDIILRIKCNSSNIKSEELNSSNNTKSFSSLYPGYREIVASDEAVQKFWEAFRSKTIPTKHLTKKKRLYPNEYLVLKNDNVERNLVAKVSEDVSRCKIIDVTQHKVDKIKPKNIQQSLAIDALLDPSIRLVTLVGPAGVGKTLLALGGGLDQVLARKHGFDNMLVIRPVHPVGKDIGFLPGGKDEKLEPWITPIKDNLRYLVSEDSGKRSKENDGKVEYLFDKGHVEIEAMAYIRGRSISNAFIIIDETQNISSHEIKTIITRVGENTKIVLTGDIDQLDRADIDSTNNGLSVAVEKFKKYPIAAHISLTEGVRSELATLASEVL